MKNVTVAKSKRPGKKYQASFEDGHTVHFGAAGMSDFTKNKDPERKKNKPGKTQGKRELEG